jgi:hypothetical protein
LVSRLAVAWQTGSWAGIVRFQRAIAAIGPATHVDWASIALGCGYFDQAHFNHDFLGFCGLAPSRYLTDRTEHPTHVDALFARATSAGAKVIEPPSDQEYGDRRCAVEDCEGHQWFFAQPVEKK